MAMKRTYHRVGFTAVQSAELWERWRKGEGLKSIGRTRGEVCTIAHRLSDCSRSGARTYRSQKRVVVSFPRCKPSTAVSSSRRAASQGLRMCRTRA
jgi:hypothetical protein